MKYFTSIIILCISNFVFAQIEHYDCPTSSYKNAQDFIYHFENSNLDSARYIVEDWIEKCGHREVNIRARILLELTEGNEVIAEEDLFYSLVEFIQRDTITGIRKKYFYEYNRPYYGYIPIGESYDEFIKEEFRNLEIQNSNEIELVRQVYSGDYDAFFEKLNSEELEESQLWKSYNEFQSHNMSLYEAHYSGFSGLWIPMGTTTLGVHPEIGFQAGVKKKRWNYDLTILFRFLKSKNEYQAFRKQTNQTITTDHFFSGYMGAEVGYDLWAKKSNEFQIATGLGIDGFDAVTPSGDLNSVSIVSYNFNLGLKYRKYINSNTYLGFGVKYNFVDYTIGNKVEFNENPIAFSFIYGFVGNKMKTSNLDCINYELRK